MREQARNKYRELSNEKKDIKREYGRNRYCNMSEENKQRLKVVSTTFLLVCFVSLKESTSDARKNVFLLHLERSFHSWDNQILTFQIFKCHDVI